MKTILLFGGSFDPIHSGHMAIVQEIRKTRSYDEIWFVLARHARWKSHATTIAHRKAMVRLALRDHPDWHLCTIELKRTKNEVSYTIDTIRELMTLYPNIKFDFLIGADTLDQLHEWKDIDTLSKLVQFIVVPRPNYELKQEVITRYHIAIIPLNPMEGASRLIRQQGIGEVPTLVQNYITEHGLYFENHVKELVKPSRFNHILSVAKVAKKLAKAHGESSKRAYIAAILHDCAKDIPVNESRHLLKEARINDLGIPDYEVHALLGWLWAQTVFHVNDIEILDAIKCHVVAKPNMTKLEKILFCADKIEPGREYNTRPFLSQCLADIDQGFKAVLWDNALYLKEKYKIVPNEYLPALKYYFPEEDIHVR